jgi:hypothetical protein
MPTSASYRRSGGFDKGRRLIRLPAIGLPSGMPAPARYEPPRGFPCQIRRGPGPPVREPRPVRTFSLPRQPTGVRRRRCGSASGRSGERAELAARAARRAALKPYRKLIASGGWSRCVKIRAVRVWAGWGRCRLAAGPGRGARVVGRYGRAARDAGQLWDANPLESLALGS